MKSARIVYAICVLTLATSAASAQKQIGCLFANNEDRRDNNIARFLAFDDATLTLLGLTPTGGIGLGAGFIAAVKTVVTPDQQCLYAVNGRSQDITAFSIDVGTCDLEAVGDPVPVATGLGGLAIDGVNNRLYATTGPNTVAGFDIHEDCSLSSIGDPPARPEQGSRTIWS